MTKALLALCALLTLSLTAHADRVYTWDYGRWHLNGYSDYNTNRSCVISTEWSDGKKIQINIFPKFDGSQNVTMTVRNPDWDNSAWNNGHAFEAQVEFYSAKYGYDKLSGTAQIYDTRKVIFRGMSGSFSKHFIKYDLMTLFPGTNSVLDVSLDGTAAIANDLQNCITTVLGGEYEEDEGEPADVGNH